MKILTYYNTPELQETEKRKRKFVSMAQSLAKYLEYLLEELDVEDYYFSHLVEDMVTWVVSDPKRLKQYIDDLYEFEGEQVFVEQPSEEFRKRIDEMTAMLFGEEDMYDEKEKRTDKNPPGPTARPEKAF